MRKDTYISKKVEIGYNIFVDDGWYGKHYFYYIETNCKTKTEAKKQYQSMIRKFLLKKFQKDQFNGLTILKPGEEQVTYIHSIGPSFYLNRIGIDIDEFNKFKEGEIERLRINKQDRG